MADRVPRRVIHARRRKYKFDYPTRIYDAGTQFVRADRETAITVKYAKRETNYQNDGETYYLLLRFVFQFRVLNGRR